jgi:hypothetical protein
MILEGVVAFVDIRSSTGEDVSRGFVKKLEKMGAEVSATFTRRCTHCLFKVGHWDFFWCGVHSCSSTA